MTNPTDDAARTFTAIEAATATFAASMGRPAILKEGDMANGPQIATMLETIEAMGRALVAFHVTIKTAADVYVLQSRGLPFEAAQAIAIAKNAAEFSAEFSAETNNATESKSEPDRQGFIGFIPPTKH